MNEPLHSRILTSLFCLLFANLTLASPATSTAPSPPSSTPTSPATSPAPAPGDANFPTEIRSNRHPQKVKEAKTGSFQLVMIGDSITHTLHQYGGKYAPLTPRVWDRYYAPHQALNLGYSGYRTENILWNLQNGELDFPSSPKLFTILLGTNNADRTNYPRLHSPKEIQAGIRAIIDLIRAKHPTSKILLIAPLPKGLHSQRNQATSPPIFSFSQEEVDTTRLAGTEIQKLADQKQVFFINLSSVYLQPDGSVNPTYLWDLLHPSPEGAEAMARALEPTIAKLMDEPSTTASIPAPKPAPNTPTATPP